MVKSDIHNKPVEVEEATDGGPYAVVVREIFNDGSEHTDHYTEEQAEEIRDRLNEIL